MRQKIYGEKMHPFEAKINQARHITLVVHEHPDADSLGSASAFYSYLLTLNKKVSLYCKTEHIDPKLTFIPWIEKLRHHFPQSSDLIISFDCGSYERMGVDAKVEVINFDHHKSNNDYGDVNRVDETAISTTQMVYDYIKYMQAKINPKMATAMYAGLLDDSKGFLSPRTDPRTFATAYDLLQKGADARVVVKNLFETVPLCVLRLKGMIFSSLRLMCDAQVAVIAVTREMLERSGGSCELCEGALEESMYLPTVHIALLVCDMDGGMFKGSLRSDGVLDVSLLATHYGGGGHAHRAGFRYSADTIEEVVGRVISDIKDTLEKT